MIKLNSNYRCRYVFENNIHEFNAILKDNSLNCKTPDISSLFNSEIEKVGKIYISQFDGIFYNTKFYDVFSIINPIIENVIPDIGYINNMIGLKLLGKNFSNKNSLFAKISNENSFYHVRPILLDKFNLFILNSEFSDILPFKNNTAKIKISLTYNYIEYSNSVVFQLYPKPVISSIIPN